jgi:hypothetical protein
MNERNWESIVAIRVMSLRRGKHTRTQKRSSMYYLRYFRRNGVIIGTTHSLVNISLCRFLKGSDDGAQHSELPGIPTSSIVRYSQNYKPNVSDPVSESLFPRLQNTRLWTKFEDPVILISLRATELPIIGWPNLTGWASEFSDRLLIQIRQKLVVVLTVTSTWWEGLSPWSRERCRWELKLLVEPPTPVRSRR